MEDLATAPLSTVLDAEPSPSPTGGGQMSLSEPEAAPKSLREDIEAAFKEADQPKEEGDDPKPDKVDQPEKGEKAKDEGAEKPEAEKSEPKEEKKPQDRAADGKFAAKPDEAEQPKDGEDKRPTQVEQGITQAPRTFLPDAKEKWANTPRAVQRDVENLIKEAEARDEQHRETTQRYDRLRDFDDLARSNGRDLRESLQQVHQFENMMSRNPVSALNMALMQVGPRKADGQPYSIYEVAQFVVQQGPEGYQQMMAQGQQTSQQQANDPRVEQLEQQLREMKVQTLTAQVIEPFKAQHPRYDELADDIALFLQSGKIPQTLSLHDRLAAAYDMAERVNPSSHVLQAPDNDQGPGTDRRADADFSGSKSIKSSPGSITETVDDQAKSGESIRDSIMEAGRRIRR